MIITNPDGTKVSSENVDRKGTPKFKCPKCGCLYFSFSDIASFFKGGDKAVTVVMNVAQSWSFVHLLIIINESTLCALYIDTTYFHIHT